MKSLWAKGLRKKKDTSQIKINRYIYESTRELIDMFMVVEQSWSKKKLLGGISALCGCRTSLRWITPQHQYDNRCWYITGWCFMRIKRSCDDHHYLRSQTSWLYLTWKQKCEMIFSCLCSVWKQWIIKHTLFLCSMMNIIPIFPKSNRPQWSLQYVKKRRDPNLTNRNVIVCHLYRVDNRIGI